MHVASIGCSCFREMFHCNGGSGRIHSNDFYARGVAEQGQAPDRTAATGGAAKDRTRPLFPLPQEVKWKVSGSTDQAENFVCAVK